MACRALTSGVCEYFLCDTLPREEQALSTAGKDPDLQWLHNEQSLGSPEVAARPISGQSEEGKRVGEAERQSALLER